MTQKENRRRLIVEIDKELHEKLQDAVPWGQMRPLVQAMLEDFIHLCEEHDSRIIIGAIVSKEITLKQFLNKYGKSPTKHE